MHSLRPSSIVSPLIAFTFGVLLAAPDAAAQGYTIPSAHPRILLNGTVRARLTVISARISSMGWSGLMNHCPRLRECNSSKNTTDTPNWLRNRMSHSNTPDSSKPAA